MQDCSAEATALQNSACVRATRPSGLILFPRREWGTRGHGKGQRESSGSRPGLGEAAGCAEGWSSALAGGMDNTGQMLEAAFQRASPKRHTTPMDSLTREGWLRSRKALLARLRRNI